LLYDQIDALGEDEEMAIDTKHLAEEKIKYNKKE
jgi:hypothetical protein